MEAAVNAVKGGMTVRKASIVLLCHQWVVLFVRIHSINVLDRIYGKVVRNVRIGVVIYVLNLTSQRSALVMNALKRMKNKFNLIENFIL